MTIPDGYTTLTPFLVCAPAADAIAFYEAVFGATTVQRMDSPDGTVPHAELDLGHGRLQLGDPNVAYDLVVPTGSAAVSQSTCIYVADVDAVFAARRRLRHTSPLSSAGPRCGRSRARSSPVTGSPR